MYLLMLFNKIELFHNLYCLAKQGKFYTYTQHLSTVVASQHLSTLGTPEYSCVQNSCGIRNKTNKHIDSLYIQYNINSIHRIKYCVSLIFLLH